MDKYYRDPKSKELREQLYDKIKEIKNSQEIYHFVKKHIPSWILYECDDYAEEYSKLSENWSKTISSLFQSKKKILIVDKIIFEDNLNQYTILRMVSEILTRAGYCVRLKDQLIPCEKCKLAIVEPDKICKKCSQLCL